MRFKPDKDSLTFLIALHAHQPVDNFDYVIEDAFNKSYQPFLDVLSDFPEIKISFHISGSLLDWALIKKPDFINQLKSMVKKGQVEILTAGYYEPILILLPEWDRIGQIQLHRSKMEHLFKVNSTGLWLTERVWEPSLPKSLKKAGIEFVIVDDEHFKLAGYDVENLTGHYITEEEGNEVAVFPGSKFLRYAMPFKLAEETIAYLKSKLERGENCIVFGDDLEKFGFWPETYKWVYEEEWLRNFFKALSENASWIKTSHFKDVLMRNNPTGRVYLPCASYSEMMEWSDNMFRNFLVKYPESNHLHKKMFNISCSIEERSLKLKSKLSEARLNLYKAQNNDTYWHGVFGGLYLTHLRHTAYKHLIKAEKELEDAFDTRFPLYEVKDFDFDGEKEVLFKDSIFNICIAPDKGGAITEIDYKPQEVNLLNTLSRKKEPYHEKVLQNSEAASITSKGNSSFSIHSLKGVKDIDLKEFLIYDSYRKSAWIDHLYGENNFNEESCLKSIQDVLPLWGKRYDYEVVGNKISQSLVCPDLNIQKSLIVKKDVLDFEYRIHSNISGAEFFSSEFNFLFYAPELISGSQIKKQDKLIIEDEWFNLKYEILFSQSTFIFSYPIETVSDSECGIEKTYQGVSLHFIWPLMENLGVGFQIKVTKK
ncbi:MAG: DUF1926 domain-containing protein [Candidatus Saelkia tenebricola]|nr:DUF1926 domain-containing protein [Candidatus Saelkia tenebricola]